MEEENQQLASSLNSRRNKKPSLSIACCFKGHHNHHQRRNSFDVSSSSSSSPAFLPSPRKSPSEWIKSKASDFPEIKGKYKNFMSKMSRDRRHSSADFSYDPLSYSLNFEENDLSTTEREDPYRSFTSRLPSSPPKSINQRSSAAPPSSESVTGITKSLSEMAVVSSPRRNVNGFDALTNRRIPEVIEVGNKVIDERKGSIEKSRTPRAAAVAEVKRSLENVTPCVVAQTALVSSSG